jgi:hypothetical protein
MPVALVIRGRSVGQTFIPEEPLPVAEGAAELIVFPATQPAAPLSGGSIFDLFGKAAHLRTAQDIEAQIREERAGWGDP